MFSFQFEGNTLRKLNITGLIQRHFKIQKLKVLMTENSFIITFRKIYSEIRILK